MKNDEGVSPVVGTILMIAATVAIGATVFTAVNAFGDDTVKEPVDAVFSARAIDTDNDGKTDVIKVTYVSGPNLPNEDTSVAISNAIGREMVTSNTNATWTPGDFRVYDWSSGTTTSTGTWLVTISARGVAVLDTSITLDE